MIKKIIKYLKKPTLIYWRLAGLNIIKVSDRKYLTWKYKEFMKKDMNWDYPKTFNEKLQWLKLYDRKDIYTTMVDKYDVKKYVSEIIGEEYVIPTIGIYDNFEQIDFDKLPNKFVIKCTHDSGGLVICNNKKALNMKFTRNKINNSLKRNFFYESREWPYKNIKPKIIIEKLIENENSTDLKDYKIFCFNGVPKTILVCSNRKGNHKNTDFFDIDWNIMPFTRENHINNYQVIEKPKKLDEMIEISKKLSADIPFVRVDLYEVNGKVYFGELTFYPSAGFEGFNPPEYDKILGDWLSLPKKKVNKYEK